MLMWLWYNCCTAIGGRVYFIFWFVVNMIDGAIYSSAMFSYIHKQWKTKQDVTNLLYQRWWHDDDALTMYGFVCLYVMTNEWGTMSPQLDAAVFLYCLKTPDSLWTEIHRYPTPNQNPAITIFAGNKVNEVIAAFIWIFTAFLFSCSVQLAAPQFRAFKGLDRITVKEKMRLNNIVWREWHLQCKSARAQHCACIVHLFLCLRYWKFTVTNSYSAVIRSKTIPHRSFWLLICCWALGWRLLNFGLGTSFWDK